MNKLFQSKKCGSSLALVLIALVILLVMGLGILGLGAHSRMLAVRASTEIAARCAADAGLTKALFEMNQKLKVKPWSDSVLPEATNEALPNCDATFSYTVTGDAASGYTIEAIGKSGNAEKRVNCILRVKGLFDSAILVKGDLTFGLNNEVKGYDSSDPAKTDLEADIGTTSTAPGSIQLGSTPVSGDVFVGYGVEDGDVDTIIDGGSNIAGDKYALKEPVIFPAISPPTPIANQFGDLSLSNDTTIGTVGSQYTAEYPSIAIEGKKLTINGDVTLYVPGYLDFGNKGEIQINSGSSLTLYIGGNIDGLNGNGFNTIGKKPASFKVYSTSTIEKTFNLKNNTDFYGAIYAPNAIVEFKNNTDMYGAITAKSFTVKNNGVFNYDVSLQNASVYDSGVQFQIDHWRDD